MVPLFGCQAGCGVVSSFQSRMAWGIHGLPKISLGPGMPCDRYHMIYTI
jgi:hypothetical protein